LQLKWDICKTIGETLIDILDHIVIIGSYGVVSGELRCVRYWMVYSFQGENVYVTRQCNWSCRPFYKGQTHLDMSIDHNYNEKRVLMWRWQKYGKLIDWSVFYAWRKPIKLTYWRHAKWWMEIIKILPQTDKWIDLISMLLFNIDVLLMQLIKMTRSGCPLDNSSPVNWNVEHYNYWLAYEAC